MGAQAKEILEARQDEKLREELISRYMNFICRCASKAAGRYVDMHDDARSVAMIAFNDAISAYDEQKGDFLAFAGVMIHNRVIDYLRQEGRHSKVVQFSLLTATDEQGDEISFDIEDKKAGVSDAALEIYSLKKELEQFDISFLELPASSPKAKKTREACLEVVRYILQNKSVLQSVYHKKQLPTKQIMENVKVNNKVLERHRKYIIAGILINVGDYAIMTEYFDCRKEVYG